MLFSVVFLFHIPHRHQIFNEASKDAGVSVSIKRVTTHRWSCRARATKALHCRYQQIKSGFDQIRQNNTEKASVHLETEGLLKQIS